MAGSLGLTEAEAYVLGGILGSGVFSVLGVVVLLAGPDAWLAYLLAGAVAVCTSYSYVQLNAASEFHGGVVTLVLERDGRPALAGTIGWILLTGFVGLLAMYGYAFGAYARAFFPLRPVPSGAVPVRPLFSAGIIAAFVGVNWAGPREAGRVEAAIVGLNVALVAAFGAVAAWHVTPGAGYAVATDGRPPSRIGIAAATAFVSLVAWQIVMYDQSRLRRPVATVKRTVLASLPVAIPGYALLSVLVDGLISPERVAQSPELALVNAARTFSGTWLFVGAGVVALGATAAAINAVLFSTTLFLEGLISYRLFPASVADVPADDLPTVPLLLVGGVAMLVATLGRIEAIVEFASLAFTVTNGIVSYLVLRDEREAVPWPIPLLGLLGTGSFVAITLWWLATRDLPLLVAVAALAVAVVAAELTYFDREIRATGER